MAYRVALVDIGSSLRVATASDTRAELWSIIDPEFQSHLFTQDTISSFTLETRDRDYHLIYHPGPRAAQWNGIKSYVDALSKLALIGIAARDMYKGQSPLSKDDKWGRASYGATQTKNGLNIFRDHEDAQRHFRDARIYHTEGYYHGGELFIRGVIKRGDLRRA
jgi:hypothetical protein